jgi:predicted unusual protein kinase regulating ubiquinone biosynthesis (AarF/ABC1/UbiB family)
MNRALVRKIITSNLGKPPEVLFASFEPTAFAAASLGQVHRAVAKDGAPLAVKIQYPGISATIRNDVQMIKALLFPLPEYQLLKPVLKEIEERLMEEIDYEQEAQHLVYFKNQLKLDHVAVPVFYPETSCQNVLSQGRLEGVPLNDWLTTDPSQEERDAVARRLHTIYLHGLYELNCIHADPNPGNFLIGPDLTIGLVDFGCIKCFDPHFVNLYKQLPRIAQKGTADEVGHLIRSFGLLGSHPDKRASEMITGIFMAIGNWFAQLYEEEYFDFGVHPDFIERGKQISYQSMALRKHMKDVNTNFVYLHRTRYGLIRLFEMMKARVRMWNLYEWEGEEDGQEKSNSS